MRVLETVKEEEDVQQAEADKYLAECVRIDPLTLTDEFVRLPSDYAYWAEQYRIALEAHLLAKAERERTFSFKYILAAESTMPSGKPATVDFIKARVEIDQGYQEAIAASIHAEVELTRIKGILEAIRTKKESLVSIGATVRQEMEHDPVVRNRVAQERSVRSDR